MKPLPLSIPAPPEAGTKHAYHLYTILLDKTKFGISRNEFLNAMTPHNISMGVHYLYIPKHPYYRKHFGWKLEDYSNAMSIGRQTVSLPISAKLTDEDFGDVTESVKGIIA